ncbi:MAG: NAD(P)/FAD-dependent oxidoreductase [Tepidiformaceae bacterium]
MDKSHLMYDALVIGGGPAGLTAALQLARFNRQVILFDSGMGRSTYHQVNHNYLGFPGGIGVREFRDIARKQVREYPIACINEAVMAVKRREGYFTARDEHKRLYRGRTAVFATGVTDHFPRFPEWTDYVGRSIFWCIVCDGYATRGKRIVIVGNATEAAVTALQFLQFTHQITMLTNAPKNDMSEAVCDELASHNIDVVVDTIAGIEGHDGILGRVRLGGGGALEADFLFSLEGCAPNNKLARSVGVEVDEEGFIITDEEQVTCVPGAFAAGDVTRILAHQVSTAVHEGNTAATAANYYLYSPWQKHETYEKSE